MKKGLKIVGTVAGLAALAALIPYSRKKDEAAGETTVNALLWKYSNRPAADPECGRQVTVDIGFNNPFAVSDSPLDLEDEDLILVDIPAEAPAEEPVCQDTPAEPCAPEAE